MAGTAPAKSCKNGFHHTDMPMSPKTAATAPPIKVFIKNHPPLIKF
jgi:hypothetical protein